MPRRRPTALRVTELESRLAPASSITFTDIDGDRVTVTATAGDLAAAGVATFAAAGAGQQLQRLNLADPSFRGASIGTAVVRDPAGDGRVNIGRIDAAGNDLGSVTVRGDLGRIDCGDGKAFTGPGLRLLRVDSMGLYGTATQGAGGNLGSFTLGALGALEVRGDMRGAGLTVFPSSVGASDGGIGTVTIGGSLIGTDLGGGLAANGDIGAVKVGGDVVGGPGGGGLISGAGRLGSLTVGGSLVGGEGAGSGRVEAAEIGTVSIRGDVRGGAGEGSGRIFSEGRLERLTVGGSVVGGGGDARFTIGGQTFEGQIVAGGDIGTVRIARDLAGAAGRSSALIRGLAGLGSVSIGGSVIGGDGQVSARVIAVGIGPVNIGGDIRGGAGPSSGNLISNGRLASVTVGGSVLGGPSASTGLILADGDLGRVTVRGSVVGTSATGTGMIHSAGALGPVRIGGDLRGGNISGTMTDVDRSGFIDGARIASVSVGGSVVSGTDDSTGGGLTRNASIRSNTEIGPVVVRGSLVGNVRVNGITPVIISARGQAVLAPGATTDLAIKSLTVGGRVEQTQVLAGFDPNLNPVNGNASVGGVTVGGDWNTSTLSAGVGPATFGDLGTAVINNGGDALVARIASVQIGGAVTGAANPTFQTGFEAEQIGSFRAGAFVAPLTAGTDGPFQLAPLKNNVFVLEV